MIEANCLNKAEIEDIFNLIKSSESIWFSAGEEFSTSGSIIPDNDNHLIQFRPYLNATC